MVDFDKYEAILCPICGKYYFSDLVDEDLEDSDQPQCRYCGWINDITQHEDHSAIGLNDISLNDFKIKYDAIVSDNPSYMFKPFDEETKPHLCPVCKKYTFKDENSFDICPNCGWEDDSLMESEPDKWAGSSNDLCLNDYILRYEELLSKDPKYKWKNK